VIPTYSRWRCSCRRSCCSRHGRCRCRCCSCCRFCSNTLS